MNARTRNNDGSEDEKGASSDPIINNAGEMFKLAGRHEWEACTKGKWNIQSVGGKGKKADLVLRGYIRGDARQGDRRRLIQESFRAAITPAAGGSMSKVTWERMGIEASALEFEDNFR